MLEKKELKQEELGKVSGGLYETASLHLENEINKYAVQNYTHVYFKHKRSNVVLYVRVIAQREKEQWFNTTITVYDVEVLDKTSPATESGFITLSCNDWHAFEKCDFQG